MTLLRPYSSRAVLDREPSRVVSVVVFLAAAVLLWVIVQVSSGINVPFDETTAPATVSTDPARLPYYAARSLLRMFAALGVSLLFTFIYATAAARLRRAQKVMLPILDILQSVPILGFLSVTITGFIALFPWFATRAGMRVDLRDLHVAGLEYDIRVLPQPIQPTP